MTTLSFDELVARDEQRIAKRALSKRAADTKYRARKNATRTDPAFWLRSEQIKTGLAATASMTKEQRLKYRRAKWRAAHKRKASSGGSDA